MDGFLYFLMFLLFVCSLATLVFVIAMSLLINKVYEMLKVQRERQDLEDEARLRTKDIPLENPTYPLRLR